MKVAIYTRVSSEEQVDGYSLSAQEEQARRFAEFKGWTVVALYEEPGRSGKSDLRPVFQQMIRDAEAHQFDVILVHKLDRFSRNVLDVLSYLKRLHQYDVSFTSVTEDFDFTTPMGRMLLTLLAAFAEWYLSNLSHETAKGKAERARKGDWNGTLPFGYTTPPAAAQNADRAG
jgi:site-specific DNA recombinase